MTLAKHSVVIPGRTAGASPESRAENSERAALDFGFAASRRPGMTAVDIQALA